VRKLRIGDRVAFRYGGSGGTVAANPYRFHGELRVGVQWDDWQGIRVYSQHLLVRLTYRPTVSPEARPVSVGALASPERRFA
jgi:hypothetical protein